LALNYPAERLEVIVVSDGSDDGTDVAVTGIGDDRVRLLRQEPRAGKSSALNLGLTAARGEIIVFADANSLYAPSALCKLVSAFADPDVGYVTGRMVYKAADGSPTGEGCSSYMRFENRLRRWETRLGSIVGTDGGIDAVRRQLFQPLRPDQLPDFALPLSVFEKGYRVIYEPEALLYEDALTTAADEYRMRVRVCLRAWHTLKEKASLLKPWRFGLFSWQLFSHKWLRYLAAFFQMTALLVNALLAFSSPFWRVVLLLQALFYGLALLGHLLRERRLPRLVMWAYYLCLVNLAAAVAFCRFVQGRQQVLWAPRTR
jgi:cellulose synthase/poly-beta-1,6-N-acetylglucosamine synthase-like glycosyltransferase